jgi:hypothetical protein
MYNISPIINKTMAEAEPLLVKETILAEFHPLTNHINRDVVPSAFLRW